MSTAYTIPSENWEPLLERLEKLTRRAVKLGRKVPILNKIGERSETSPKGLVKTFYDVTIESEPIAVNGWTFMASIDVSDDPEIGRVLNRAPGILTDITLPAKYRKANTSCDHCAVNRRRNTVFVLYNEATTEWKKVGRNCLATFLGGVNPEEVVQRMEILISLDGLCSGAGDPDFFGMGGKADLVDLHKSLTFTAFLISENGWMSRSKSRELAEAGEFKKATADDLAEAYFVLPQFQTRPVQDLVSKFGELDDQEIKRFENQVEAAIEWIRSLSEEDNNNDYLRNLYIVCHKDTYVRKHIGIAASLLIAHQNTLGRIEKFKVEAEARKDLVHVGTVGSREEFVLKVVSLNFFQNNYGGTTFVSMVDINNNKVLWKASNSPDLTIGNTYSLKAKVKAHIEYKGAKQTEISHAKISGAVGSLTI